MHKHPTTSTRPFLKWAGGKQRLLKSLLPLLPAGARLIEPFVGAGSVFLASDYPAYILNDANADLVAVWTALKRSPCDYVRDAAAYFCETNHNQSSYLALRETFNASSDPHFRATLLPYLNRFGFNGLYRVNRAGAFNVPYGKPAQLPVFPMDAALQAANRLQRAAVQAGDFQAAIDLAVAGDIVYCDPPYHRSARGASFAAYTSDGFGDADHLRLVDSARAAAARGARVFISNHDTPVTRALYKDFRIHELRVNRSIASTKAGRGTCGELLAVLERS